MPLTAISYPVETAQLDESSSKERRSFHRDPLLVPKMIMKMGCRIPSMSRLTRSFFAQLSQAWVTPLATDLTVGDGQH